MGSRETRAPFSQIPFMDPSAMEAVGGACPCPWTKNRATNRPTRVADRTARSAMIAITIITPTKENEHPIQGRWCQWCVLVERMAKSSSHKGLGLGPFSKPLLFAPAGDFARREDCAGNPLTHSAEPFVVGLGASYSLSGASAGQERW